MLKLIKNELSKIFHKKSTYIMLILILLVPVGVNIILKFSLNNSYYTNSTSQETYSSMITAQSNEQEKYVYTELDAMGHSPEESDSWANYCAQSILTYEVPMDYVKSLIDSIKTGDYNKYYETIISVSKANNANSSLKTYADIIQECIDKKFDISDTLRLNRLIKYASASLQYVNKNEKSAQQNINLTGSARVYAAAKYCFENDTDAVMYSDETSQLTTESSFIRTFNNTPSIVSVIAIFMIIIAGGIIATEFSSGTIKFLLVNPVKRAKIYWSKYLTCVLLTIIISIIFFLANILFAILFNGSGDLGGKYISMAADGTTISTSIILYVGKNFILQIVGVISNMTLAFAISSLLRSSSIAIGLSLAIQLVGGSITAIIATLNIDWGRYLLFSNTDLGSIIAGQTLYPNQTLLFAVCTITIYMIIFLLTGYDAFVKREV